jgi:hypothetical protein
MKKSEIEDSTRDRLMTLRFMYPNAPERAINTMMKLGYVSVTKEEWDEAMTTCVNPPTIDPAKCLICHGEKPYNRMLCETCRYKSAT